MLDGSGVKAMLYARLMIAGALLSSLKLKIINNQAYVGK